MIVGRNVIRKFSVLLSQEIESSEVFRVDYEFDYRIIYISYPFTSHSAKRKLQNLRLSLTEAVKEALSDKETKRGKENENIYLKMERYFYGAETRT